MRRWLACAIAAAFLAAVATAPHAGAFQFDLNYVTAQPEPGCPLNDGYVSYSFTPESDPAALADVRAAFSAWNGFMEMDNFFYLTYIEEVPFGATNVSPYRVTVDVRNTGMYGGNLLRDCNTMLLNTFWGTGSVLRGAATHEMGHALGLFHTGVEDSFVGETKDFYPAMTTCLDSVFEQEFLGVRQDDRAAVQFLHGDSQFDHWSSQFMSVSANPGMENAGTRDWSARSGSMISSQTTTAANGARSLYLRSATGESEAYQRVTFAPTQDVNSHLVFASIQTKKHTATDVGTVQLSVLERTVTYELLDPNASVYNGDCVSSEYPIAVNANKRAIVGSPVQIGYATCIPQTTWAPCQSEAGYTRGSASSLYDASDLYVVARSAMRTSTGAWSGVDLDDMQVGYYGAVADAA